VTRSPIPVRLLSLDAFRGLTMAGMTIVNNPGDWATVYAPLLHAEWNGCTPTDLVFPFFLFIVGVAITLSRKAGGWQPIVWRGVKLILIGWFLSGFPFYHLATLRIPGVLQRIGLCYMFAALLYRALRQSVGTAGEESERRIGRAIAVVAAVLLVGYWGIVMLVPGASGTAGDMTPEGNVGAVIDRALFGGHIWKVYDPEGLLSTIPAIGTTLVGLLAGLWLRFATDHRRNVVRGLLVIGASSVALGLAWSLVFPLNKALWTSSYALYTAGLGALVFGACYAIIDVVGWRRWAHPLVVLGSNAIALYVLSGLLARLTLVIKVTGPAGEPISLKTWIYNHWFLPLAASPYNASLLFALANVAVLYVVLAAMYRRGVFWKV
jgi:predicted acyltransferase